MSAWRCPSDRPVGAVLIGEDPAAHLIAACSAGDGGDLRRMFDNSEHAQIALASSPRIMAEISPSASGERRVQAVLTPHIRTILNTAVRHGNSPAVSTVLDFASCNHVPISELISRETINCALESGSVSVFETLTAADSTTPTRDLGHGQTPLYTAVMAGQTGLVAWLTDHKSIDVASAPSALGGNLFGASMLAAAARTRNAAVVESLLAHKRPVKDSGALHVAAMNGDLDIMRLLVDYGADPNEPLPQSQRIGVPRDEMTSWTPMQFAIYNRQDAAALWLKSQIKGQMRFTTRDKPDSSS